MPVLKLTKSNVEAVPYAVKGQVLYCDEKLKGFYLVVGKQSKSYVVQKDIRGRAVRRTIGKHGHFTPEEARKAAREKLHQLAKGIDPRQSEKEHLAREKTLEQILEEYLKVRSSLKPRTRKDYNSIVGNLLSDWKFRPMRDITKHMIMERHAKITEENGPYPANKAMRILRTLFNHAIATYDIVPANPALYLTQARAWHKEQRRRSYIRPDQLEVWWDAVHELQNDTYRDFLLLLLFTGLRRNEAASLKWEQVNFADKSFTIENTKNGDPLTLPLNNFLYEMLEARRKCNGNQPFVFPGCGKHGYLAEPKKGIYKVIEMSGVRFTCHDLRRTFITIAESLDISAYALKRLMNHRVHDVTGGYIIVDVERLRDPVGKIEKIIMEKVNG